VGNSSLMDAAMAPAHGRWIIDQNAWPAMTAPSNSVSPIPTAAMHQTDTAKITRSDTGQHQSWTRQWTTSKP